MDLRTYLKSQIGMAVVLAQKLGMNAVYLRHVASATTQKRCSAETAIAIEVATDGAVPRHELRPDLWMPPEAANDPVQPPCQQAVAS